MDQSERSVKFQKTKSYERALLITKEVIVPRSYNIQYFFTACVFQMFSSENLVFSINVQCGINLNI